MKETNVARRLGANVNIFSVTTHPFASKTLRVMLRKHKEILKYIVSVNNEKILIFFVFSETQKYLLKIIFELQNLLFEYDVSLVAMQNI